MQNLPPINGVPSQLSNSALLAQKASIEVGETVESVLIKYGKRITGKILEKKICILKII